MSAEPPKIQINEVFSPTMNLNGFGNFLSDPETPTKANGKYATASSRFTFEWHEHACGKFSPGG